MKKNHVSWRKIRPEQFDGIHVLYNLSREIQADGLGNGLLLQVEPQTGG